jgi:hypothetical protein
VLALSEKQQAERITKLGMTYANLKREKDNVTIGYRRLVAKHDAFVEKAELQRMKVVEAHAVELA